LVDLGSVLFDILKIGGKMNFNADTFKLTPTNNGVNNLYDLVNIISNWVFIVAGLVAFFYLIYAGFTYLTAGGNPDAAKKGQQGILNAVIGLIVIFLAYAIVRGIAGFLNMGG